MIAVILQGLLPMIVLGATALVVMLITAFRRHHGLTATLSALGLVAALAVLPLAGRVVPREIGLILTVDAFALFYTALMVAAALALVILSYGYFRHWSGRREEYYLLLLLATLGALVLAGSRHFTSLLLGIELVSVSLFALIAYPGLFARPLEAGIKYLVLAGVSSAFLVFGMALVYARLGALDFATLRMATAAPESYVLIAGLVLIVVAVGFKLSLVPFHFWTPDVFQGAPLPVAALLATVSKGAVLAVILRYFATGDGLAFEPVVLGLALIAAASMLVGNLLALLQRDVKRLLAYSSIAHFGYLLMAFVAGGSLAAESIGFYLAAYFATTLAAFGVLTVLAAETRSIADPDAEIDEGATEPLRGILWRRPALAILFLLSLISLAGLPITIGFVGKFYLLAAAVEAGLWTLVAAFIIGSAIGLFYYLRLAMIVADTRDAAAVPSRPAQPASYAVLALLGFFILGFGAYPTTILDLARSGVIAPLQGIVEDP